MNLNSTIDLFCDPNETPPYYWVNVSSAYDPEEQMLQNGGNVTFVATANASGNYELHLLVESCANEAYLECPLVHQVELGNLTTTGVDCGVDIGLYLSNSRIGGGLPKLASATQTTRPIRKLIS